MDDLGRFLIKVAAFCFIGAGAAVAYIVMPLIDYAQEERVLRYQVEEVLGEVPSAETCVASIAEDSLAECKTSLYMQDVLTAVKGQLNVWIQLLTLLGILSLLAGGAIHGASQIRKKKRLEEAQDEPASE